MIETPGEKWCAVFKGKASIDARTSKRTKMLGAGYIAPVLKAKRD
jgi:hypothetical protein